MIRYLTCLNCHRHVNATDAQCPFCDTAMPTEAPRSTGVILPVGRLGRIAVLAAGAALASGSASCDDNATNKPDAGTGGKGGGAGGGGAGGAGGTGGGTPGTGGLTPIDASTSQDAGTQFDAPIAIYSAAIALPPNKT